MDWLHRLIEAAKAPADAACGASEAGVSGAGDCARKNEFGADSQDFAACYQPQRCRRLRRL